MSNQHAEFWIARAKTPATRARIRRLSRLEDITSGILLTWLGLYLLMSLTAVVLAIWFWTSDGGDSTIFLWVLGITLGVTVACVFLNNAVETRLAQAKFADGRSSVGVIDTVLSREEVDGEGLPETCYTLQVTAALPEGVTIRRHMDWSTDGGSGSSDTPDETWVGRRIGFRHNTLDPEDLADEQFAGWPDPEEGRS